MADVVGTSGDDTLSGGAGADFVAGEAGNDALYGLAGDDYLEGGEDDDLLDGGADFDAAYYWYASGSVYVDLNIVDYQYTGQGWDQLISIEAVVGSDFDDELIGDGFYNVLWGNFGQDYLRGGGGGDVLYGGEDDDYLSGDAGDDYLDGEGGSDTAYYWNAAGPIQVNLTIVGAQNTGEGLDELVSIENILGSDFNDILTGDAGANTLWGNLGVDQLKGGGSGDTLYGGGGGDNLQGEAGDDWLYGEADNDTLLGGAGADRLDGGGGADQMTGGADNDTYFVDDAGDAVFETSTGGIDQVITSVSYTLTAGSYVETLRTYGSSSTAPINLTGNAFANTLVGNAAANRLNGGAGADTLWGHGGNDTFVVDNTGDKVVELAGGGLDTVEASVNHTLAAEVENLVLTGAANLAGTGNALANQITGNAGANKLTGGAGADTLIGLGGNDSYYVDSAADVVVEQAGGGVDQVFTRVSYTLAAGSEVEKLTTYGSSTTAVINLTGNALANTLVGNAAANRLDGGGGADILWGHAGNDTYVVDNAGDKVVESAGGGTDTVEASVDHTLADEVENLVLTGTANLAGTGNDLANQITGNAGANSLNGGAGADTMTGLGGDDSYYVDNAGDRVVEAAGGGVDAVYTRVSYALEAGSEVEKLTTYGSSTTAVIDLTGNGFANTLVGNAAANRLNGGGGADTMWGYAGNDTYVVDSVGDRVVEQANGGIDTVESSVNQTLSVHVENLVLTGTGGLTGTGNGLANVITGNGGGNRLSGAGGADTLTGGLGADVFVFALATDAGDVITDFNTAEDKLDVSALLDSVGYAGSDPFADGYLLASGTASGTDVLFDADGGGNGYVVLAQLTGVTPAQIGPEDWVL